LLTTSAVLAGIYFGSPPTPGLRRRLVTDVGASAFSAFGSWPIVINRLAGIDYPFLALTPPG
jgi:hypothetical protein